MEDDRTLVLPDRLPLGSPLLTPPGPFTSWGLRLLPSDTKTSAFLVTVKRPEQRKHKSFLVLIRIDISTNQQQFVCIPLSQEPIMASTNNPAVQRSEDFFRYCNQNRRYLRSKQTIKNALGVFPITKAEIDRIFASATLIWTHIGGTPYYFVPRSPATMAQFDAAATQLRARHPGFFQMPFLGPEEQKFVRERAADVILVAENESNRPARRFHRRNAANVADGDEVEAEDEGVHLQDLEDLESNDDENDQLEVAEEEEQEEEQDPTMSTESSPAASSVKSSNRAEPTTPAKTTTSAPARVPAIAIEVWSTKHARSLFKLNLKDVLAEDAEGHVPSFAILQEHARATIPPGTPTPDINGQLQFVHVMTDGTNTSFISQEVLALEWKDWRRSSSGRTFHLWVRDCVTEDANLKSQPAVKYGVWGWEYHPLLNGPIRFVKLPLRS